MQIIVLELLRTKYTGQKNNKDKNNKKMMKNDEIRIFTFGFLNSDEG